MHILDPVPGASGSSDETDLELQGGSDSLGVNGGL